MKVRKKQKRKSVYFLKNKQSHVWLFIYMLRSGHMIKIRPNFDWLIIDKLKNYVVIFSSHIVIYIVIF